MGVLRAEHAQDWVLDVVWMWVEVSLALVQRCEVTALLRALSALWVCLASLSESEETGLHKKSSSCLRFSQRGDVQLSSFALGFPRMLHGSFLELS